MTESFSSDKLMDLFRTNFGMDSDRVEELPGAGSDRKYYRYFHKGRTIIGCSSTNQKETKAFLSFTDHFFQADLPVPELYAVDESGDFYFIEDFGDGTFFNQLVPRSGEKLSEDQVNQYKLVLDQLVRFQLDGHKKLDYSVAYPRDSFDQQSVMWDLYYFKYYFLKIHVDFDEQTLENEFLIFADKLLSVEHDYFMYRDFQSRNIIFKDGKPKFIDYQGGRKGPLQYDLASLLYQAKVDMPFEQRELLLDYYIQVLKEVKPTDEKAFKSDYYMFVLIRTLQVLGAYGFRGLIQKKQHFIDSIPYAWKNLNWLLSENLIPEDLPYLKEVLGELLEKTFYFQTVDYANNTSK